MALPTAISFVVLLAAASAPAPDHAEMNQPFPPHRIADNLYYVGSKLLATYLVTTGEGNLRGNVAAGVLHHPRGKLHGRAIQPLVKSDQMILLLNDAAIREWAVAKGVSAKEMFNAAVKAGTCDQALQRYALGRGTIEYGAQTSYVQCWKLYPERMGAASVAPLMAQRVSVVGDTSDASGAGQ